MSCVVAVRTSRGMWIGGDSCMNRGGEGHTVAILAEGSGKVFRVGCMLMGVVGSTAISKALRLSLAAPAPRVGADAHEYLFEDVCPRVLHVAEACRAVEPDGTYPASIIVAVAGRLFEIDGRGAPVEISGVYHAAGSGEDPALGAMYALTRLGQVERDAELCIRTALAAAAEHRIYVRAPFHVVSIPATEYGL